MMTPLLLPLLALGISVLGTPAWAQDAAANAAPAEPACASLSDALSAINAALDEALLDEVENYPAANSRSTVCRMPPLRQ